MRCLNFINVVLFAIFILFLLCLWITNNHSDFPTSTDVVPSKVKNQKHSQNNQNNITQPKILYTNESEKKEKENSFAPAKPLDGTVHVVISVDRNQSQGLLPLIQSLKENCSIQIMIHIVCSTKDKRLLQQLIECVFSQTEYFQIRFVEYDLPKHQFKIRSHDKQYLASSANFVRFYFPKIFPSLTHILYLDVDTIVKHDISELWKQVIATEKFIVAVKRNGSNISQHFNLIELEPKYKQRYGIALDKTIPDYNAGVLGINLEMWRKHNLTKEAVYWMEMNVKYPLYGLGTQPILYLVVGNNWDRAEPNYWNVDGLGWKKNKLVSKAYILHWNGDKKPWLKNPIHFEDWETYRTKVCNKLTEEDCISIKASIGICK